MNCADTRAAAVREAARLQATHQQLTAASVQEVVKQLQPAASDNGGAILHQLLQWRQLRTLAIQQEVDRLAQDWGITPGELAAAVAELPAGGANAQATSTGDSAKQDPAQARSSSRGGLTRQQGRDGGEFERLIGWMQQYGAVVSGWGSVC